MANDNLLFKLKINDWADSVMEAIPEIIDDALDNAARDIVKLSPVDTGRFRGNWQATGNSPSLISLNNYDKDGADTIKSLRRQIHALARDKATHTIYITNALTYSVPLEFGYSGQAPNGVLGIVTKRLGFYFNDAIRKKSNAL